MCEAFKVFQGGGLVKSLGLLWFQVEKNSLCGFGLCENEEISTVHFPQCSDECLFCFFLLHLAPPETLLPQTRVQSGFVIIINQHVSARQRLLRLPDLLGCGPAVSQISDRAEVERCTPVSSLCKDQKVRGSGRARKLSPL